MAKVSAAKGFTLIEVMVAVVILSLTATAALRLVIIAQSALSEAGQRQLLMDSALDIQTSLRIGKGEGSGTSGDISWESVEKHQEMLGENFGKLDFDKNTPSGDNRMADGAFELKWKELTVKNKDGTHITLCLPAEVGTSKGIEKSTVSSDVKK